MEAFAPGPWKTSRALLHDVWCGEWTKESPKFVIAQQVRGRTDLEMEANATLIAAAPDLVKALKQIYIGAAESHDGLSYDEIAKIADAALKKALTLASDPA